jgi:hypothetical protein
MTKATGSFEVTSMTEDPYEELDGGIKLTHASGAQRFTGDIEGDGAVHWLMLYRPDKTARFVGLQRITGTVAGRRGTFVLAAEGDHEGGSSEIRWTVVSGSGTGDLAGISGTGSMTAPGGAKGTYELTHTVEA